MSAINTIVSNKVTGSTLADKINNACIALNATGYGGVVEVYSEASVNMLSQPVTILPNQTLRIYDGVYKFTPGNSFIQNDYSHIVGSGFGRTIIEEPYLTGTYALDHSSPYGMPALQLFHTVAETKPTTYMYGQDNRNNAVYGLKITNLEVRGDRRNPPGVGETQCVRYNNAHDSEVSYVLFNGINAMAARIGFPGGANTASQLQLSRDLGGIYASNYHFRHNTVQYCGGQNLAIDNASNCLITDNLFLTPSPRPFIITNAVSNGNGTTTFTTDVPHNLFDGASIFVRDFAGSASWVAYRGLTSVQTAVLGSNTFTVALNSGSYGTYTPSSGRVSNPTNYGTIVDIEAETGPSTTFGHVYENICIDRNIFDLSACDRYCAAIGVAVADNGGVIYGGSISDNQIRGVTVGAGDLTSGIAVNHDSLIASPIDGMTISRNRIDRATQSGLTIAGTHLTVEDNVITNSRADRNWEAMEVHNLSYSTLKNNVIQSFVSSGSNHVRVYGACTGNRWISNIFGGYGSNDNHGPAGIIHDPGSTVTHDWYFNNYCLSGNGITGTISESVNSNSNIFDNNCTGSALARVGGASRILTHKLFSGSFTDKNGLSLVGIYVPYVKRISVNDTVGDATWEAYTANWNVYLDSASGLDFTHVTAPVPSSLIMSKVYFADQNYPSSIWGTLDAAKTYRVRVLFYPNPGVTAKIEIPNGNLIVDNLDVAPNGAGVVREWTYTLPAGSTSFDITIHSGSTSGNNVEVSAIELKEI